MLKHALKALTTERRMDGLDWYRGRCKCGWVSGLWYSGHGANKAVREHVDAFRKQSKSTT